jgi:hypothetical protein
MYLFEYLKFYIGSAQHKQKLAHVNPVVRTVSQFLPKRFAVGTIVTSNLKMKKYN